MTAGRDEAEPATRPAPQYGEYASPEELAALRPPEPEPALPAAGSDAPSRPAPASGWRRFDRPVTIGLVLLGVLNLIQYGAPLLDFEAFLEVTTAETAYAPIDFGEAARIGGVVLFGMLALLVLVSALGSYAALRQGRVAFWIPLSTGALSLLAWVGTLFVIVLQTPGASAGL